MLLMDLRWTKTIQTRHLPAQEDWKYLSSNIILKLDQPLPALTLSKKEYGETITIIKDNGLPHSSICRKSPLELVHGTSDCLRFGMDNL